MGMVLAYASAGLLNQNCAAGCRLRPRLPSLSRLGADLFPWLGRAFDKLLSLAGQEGGSPDPRRGRYVRRHRWRVEGLLAAGQDAAQCAAWVRHRWGLGQTGVRPRFALQESFLLAAKRRSLPSSRNPSIALEGLLVGGVSSDSDCGPSARGVVR